MRFSSPLLILFFALPAFAKTGIRVERFKDDAPAQVCAKTTLALKANFARDLQGDLISGLLRINRFDIQEREIRPIVSEQFITGSIQQFEVCTLTNGTAKAQIALEVQVVSAKNGLTHVFTSNAQASGATVARAQSMAVAYALREIIKRVDDAIPRRSLERVPSSLPASDNGITLQLVRRDRR